MKIIFILLYLTVLFPPSKSETTHYGNQVATAIDFHADVGSLATMSPMPTLPLEASGIPEVAPRLANGHPRHHWKDSKWRLCEALDMVGKSYTPHPRYP